MSSLSRFRSLRSAGIAAILSAGLVLFGTPVAAFDVEDGGAGSPVDTADTTGTEDAVEPSGLAADAGADAGTDAGTDADQVDSEFTAPEPDSDAAPDGEDEENDVADPPSVSAMYSVSGVTRNGYGRLLGGVQVTLNGWADEDAPYGILFETTSEADGSFEFTGMTGDYLQLCLDNPVGLFDESRCSSGPVFTGEDDVTGLLGMAGWKGSEPQPDNLDDLALTGMRAVGATVTWSEQPDWSSYTQETGFNMALEVSRWSLGGQPVEYNYSPPAAPNHTLVAADVATAVNVQHFFSFSDLPYPDAGWPGTVSIFLSLPMPSAPAADSDALHQLPRGSVTAPASNVAGGSITVTVGAEHNGEIVSGWLYSTPTFLGQAVVVNGTATFTLPAGMTGSHTIAVTSSSGQLIGWAPISIQTAGGASGDTLAATGAGAPAPIAVLGALTLLAGGLLLLAASRRRGAEADRAL